MRKNVRKRNINAVYLTDANLRREKEKKGYENNTLFAIDYWLAICPQGPRGSICYESRNGMKE